MVLRHFVLCAAAALACAAAMLVFPADGQQPPNVANESVVVEAREDGTLVERTPGGKTLRTYQKTAAPRVEIEYQEIEERSPDGSVSRRTVQVPVVRGGEWYSPYGVASASADAQSQKLLAEEQAAAVDARTKVAELQRAKSVGEDQSELKKQLRDKLAKIFELQQQRRTHEIAKIEDRLAKLKGIVEKRETAKDSIIDRRLETLTGGVDELGWEESFPTLPTLTPSSSQPNAIYPPVVPRYDTPDPSSDPTAPGLPGAAPPGRAPGTIADPVPVPAIPAAAPAPPAAPVPPVAPAPPTAPRR
jgi:hypothetical protein